MVETVLVTGAGGFVGGHVVEALLTNTDYHVVAVDSFRHNGAVDKLVASADVDRSRVDLLTHDLTVPFSSTQRRLLDDVTVIVDVASRSSVDESITEPRQFVLNNVAVTLTVLELARDLDVRRFVHVSTDEVYGPTSPRASTDHRPSSPYAASKAAQEDVCHAYARTYAVPTTVVTSANMFGERQSELAFIPRIVRALVRGESIPIHVSDGVAGQRRYTYVRNVALELVREVLVGHDETERLTFTGQRLVDNLTLARWIADYANLDLRYRLVDVANVRPGYDPTYAALGGWQPTIDFERGLRTTVEWFIRHYREEIA